MIVIASRYIHRRHYRLLLARSFNALPFNKPGSKTGPIVKCITEKKAKLDCPWSQTIRKG